MHSNSRWAIKQKFIYLLIGAICVGISIAKALPQTSAQAAVLIVEALTDEQKYNAINIDRREFIELVEKTIPDLDTKFGITSNENKSLLNDDYVEIKGDPQKAHLLPILIAYRILRLGSVYTDGETLEKRADLVAKQYNYNKIYDEGGNPYEKLYEWDTEFTLMQRFKNRRGEHFSIGGLYITPPQGWKEVNRSDNHLLLGSPTGTQNALLWVQDLDRHIQCDQFVKIANNYFDREKAKLLKNDGYGAMPKFKIDSAKNNYPFFKMVFMGGEKATGKMIGILISYKEKRLSVLQVECLGIDWESHRKLVSKLYEDIQKLYETDFRYGSWNAYDPEIKPARFFSYNIYKLWEDNAELLRQRKRGSEIYQLELLMPSEGSSVGRLRDFRRALAETTNIYLNSMHPELIKFGEKLKGILLEFDKSYEN